MKEPNSISIDTQMAHIGENRSDLAGAVVPPVFQNSLFTFRNWDDIDAAFTDRMSRPIYTRQINPTARVAEQKIAALATASRTDIDAKLTASGMAAISAALLHVLSPGDHVVAVKNVYGPTNNLLNRYLRQKMNIDTTFVDGSLLSDFEEAITDQTKLIMLESPSSAVFTIQNIPEITKLARTQGITTVMDNTWATPVFQKPLDMGVDLEVHSVTKYIGGHSDVLAGAIIGSKDQINKIAITEGELLGGTIAPWNAWLITRSLRTLSMRLERHQKNAMAVASYLEQHPRVKKVRYPGLSSHVQYDLACRQMSGFTGLMGFELAANDLDTIKRFFNGMSIFQIGVSWGGHESLIYAPAISYLKELPPERFKDLGISLGDIRISVGLEDANDLIADLSEAFERM